MTREGNRKHSKSSKMMEWHLEGSSNRSTRWPADTSRVFATKNCAKLKHYFWNVNKTQLWNCASTKWCYATTTRTKKCVFATSVKTFPERTGVDILNSDGFISIATTTALAVVELSPLLQILPLNVIFSTASALISAWRSSYRLHLYDYSDFKKIILKIILSTYIHTYHSAFVLNVSVAVLQKICLKLPKIPPHTSITSFLQNKNDFSE